MSSNKKKKVTYQSDDELLIKEIASNSKSLSTKKIEELEYPIFCFQYLQDDSIKSCKDVTFLFNFLMRLKKLSEIGWKEIRISPKHSFGTEKIKTNQLKPKLPSSITPDVTELTVFRAVGDNRPFLGFSTGGVFHVVFIEANFNDIYFHGKK